MYTPAAFQESDPDVIAAMIARAGLGIMVGAGPQGLTATHLPFLHDRERGLLIGHVARANPHRPSGEVLVIFQGPHGYVSPSWYPSKAVHGRQVPTWNYEAVHVTGRARVFDDRDALLDVVERLSDAHEAGRPEPWRVDEAPEAYVEALLRGIVGIEIAIERVEAKRKLGQNKDAADRAGVAAGLRADGRVALADLTPKD